MSGALLVLSEDQCLSSVKSMYYEIPKLRQSQVEWSGTKVRDSNFGCKHSERNDPEIAVVVLFHPYGRLSSLQITYQ